MKKRVLFAMVLLGASFGLKAQDCNAIMLPYFGGDADRMANYMAVAPEKFEYRCVYASNAFYEADAVPADAEVLPISIVQSRFSEDRLSDDIVVDINTFSYYAYNFNALQMSYSDDKVLCFSTPSSAHPYLVLRSLHEMLRIANEWWTEQQTIH